MLTVLARVEPGVMAMKVYSTFLKASALMDPRHHCLVSYTGPLRSSLCSVIYRTAERQSVYCHIQDCWETVSLVSYTGLLRSCQFTVTYRTAEKQSVYCHIQDCWEAVILLSYTGMLRSNQCILQPHPTQQCYFGIHIISLFNLWSRFSY